MSVAGKPLYRGRTRSKASLPAEDPMISYRGSVAQEKCGTQLGEPAGGDQWKDG